ncbi:hypothetical protein RUM44_006597 [Polyplax serrata]|uniref:snRNA-activating protein complex subunit 3 n=1 Tax=Polyplax serrata TaxID=468196 RepID=A0ABR1AKA3_POLSC
MALGIDYAKDSVFNQKFDIESELIDIKAYFSEFAEYITPFSACDNVKCKEENGCGAENCKTDEIYRNYMGITQEELNELKERTSIDNLKCEDEVEYYKTDTENPLKNDLTTELSEEASGPNSPLVSVQKRWEMSNVTKTEFPRSYFKYCNHEWYRSGDKMTKSKLTFDNLQFPTIVACVKVYHPFLSHRERNVKVKLLQEIHILGEQTLTQLKDKIVCSLDHIGDKDMSNECFLKEVGYNVTAQAR